MGLREQIDEENKKVLKKENENSLLEKTCDECGVNLHNLAARLDTVHKGLSFLETLANERRGGIKEKLESVITEALRGIYDDSYRAELSYDIKNNRSHLSIEMVRDIPDGEVRRESGGFGGGLADTLSVPLRLMILVGGSDTDRVCVLDECWKHIDSNRIDNVGEFLKVISEKLEIQILFCTHHEKLMQYAEKSFMIEETDGVSTIGAVE